MLENRINEFHLDIAQVANLGIFSLLPSPLLAMLKRNNFFSSQSQVMIMECLSAIKLKPGCPFLFALRRVNRKLKLVQLKLIPVIAIPYQR